MKKFIFLLFCITYHTTIMIAQNSTFTLSENDTIGVINISVANIRLSSAYSAEMTTQATLGTPVRILEKKKGWIKVQTPDGYTGWTNSSTKVMNKEELSAWFSKPKIIYTKLFGFSYSEASEKSQSVSDLVGGAILEQTGSKKSFYQVTYPDGRVAYVSKKECMPLNNWKETRSLTGENITKTAFSLLGIPYLWGGTSIKGMDCSGFTKTVYYLNGVILRRDASQQVHGGLLIDTSNGFDHVLPGDLLFFGEKASGDKPERIIHVGISLGKTEFIHASGMIRLGSFDKGSPLYDEYNLKRFIRAKRMIGHIDGINSWNVADLDIYK